MAYYIRTYNPQPTTRVASTDLKNEFQAVENGLASAEAADGKAIRAPEATTALPSAASRALKVLSFDASGNPVTTFAKADIDAQASAAAASAIAADSSAYDAAASSSASGASAVAAALSESAAAASAAAADASADAAAASTASIAGGPVASVNGMTGVVTLALIASYEYDNRAALRSLSPANGDAAVVKGLGMFIWESGSTEPDDDESCFATATGRWLLQAASWDLVDAWQLPEFEERDAYDEDEPLRFASSFASKVLTGTATCSITSVSTLASTSFTGTVTGAALGDRVIATPPAELGVNAGETGRLGYHAWVSAANTVTVMLTNASASSANTNAAIRTAWPITVIKS